MKNNFSFNYLNIVFCFGLFLGSYGLSAQNGIVKNALYDKYLELAESFSKLNSWENSLSKEQRQELNNHRYYVRLRSNGDDCSGAKYTARTFSGAAALIYTAQIDFNYFYKCDLWYIMHEQARDSEKADALKVLKKVADKGNAFAQFHYATNHSYEIPGIGFTNLKQKEDMAVFFKYMQMAYDNGDTNAADHLVRGYEHVKDYKNAFQWLNIAIAEEKYDHDKDNYYWKRGNYYRDGKGVAKNLDKAYTNYKKAADLSRDYYYSFEFGKALYEGKSGMATNKSEGAKYIRKAAESGSNSNAENYCRQNGISYTKKY